MLRKTNLVNMYSRHYNSSICGWNRKLSLGTAVTFCSGPGPRPLGWGPICWEKESHFLVICDSFRTHRLPAMCTLKNSAWRLPTAFGLCFLTGFHLATISIFPGPLVFWWRKIRWPLINLAKEKVGDSGPEYYIIIRLTIPIKNPRTTISSSLSWNLKERQSCS